MAEYITSNQPSVVIMEQRVLIAFKILSKLYCMVFHCPLYKRQVSISVTRCRYSYSSLSSVNTQCWNLPLNKDIPMIAYMKMIKPQTIIPFKIDGKAVSKDITANISPSLFDIRRRGFKALIARITFKDLLVDSKSSSVLKSYIF